MYEVTCFHCGHVANISPDVERCAVCGADLRHLIAPDYASHYFYERAAEMAAAGEVTLALLEVDRGLAYRPSSELYLLAAILAQRLGDHAQVRRYVSAIPVDDVLRPEAEWLLRSQQTAIRPLRGVGSAGNTPPVAHEPAWLAGPMPPPRLAERPVAVRANALLYGAVALALVILVGWLALQPIAAMIQQVLNRDSGVAQVTVTPIATAPSASIPLTATKAVAPAGILPTPTPTSALPSDLVQQATVEPLAASTPVVPGDEATFDLKGYLAQTNRPELAELEVSAILQGTTLKLQGIVPLYDQRAAIIELAKRIPNVSEVDGVDLLTRLPESYTVQEGDSLWLISYKLYGEDRVADLYAANRETLPSPEALRVGQVLKVPPKP